MDKKIEKRNIPERKDKEITSVTLISLKNGDDYDMFSEHIKENYLPNTMTIKVRDGVKEMYFENDKKK